MKTHKSSLCPQSIILCLFLLGTCLEIKLPHKYQINILEEDGEMKVEPDVGLEGVAEPDVKAM